MASDARSRSPQDGARRRREFNRSPYVTLGAVRYAVRRAPPPSRTCPCRCCTSEDLLAACLGRTAPPDRRRTLERLQRFRFGRGASGERERRAGSADRPRPDRTERLRELTERLRGGSRITASSLPEEPHSAPVLPPVPPPRSRHSRASPAREPSLCCAIPPSNPRAKTDDRTSEDERDSGTREDFFDADDIRLVKVEPRSIVGSYAQKTIPFRSASFSQGDFASEKYYRGTGRQPSIFDFGRRPTSKSADSTGVRVECVTNEPATPRDVESSSLATEETVTEGGSTASVDSAVGSDEGLLAQVSPVPRSPPADGLHKQLGSRSLTHPLPRRGGSQERTGPGGSLQFLATSRVLHEVREESDASLADSAQPHSEGVSPLEPAPAFDFPPPAEAPPCANVDCECSSARVLVSNREGEMRTAIACAIPVPVYECIVKEWSTSIDRSDGGSPSDASLAGEKEDEPITSEKVESLLAAVQNPSTPVPLIGNKERRRPLDKTKQTKRRKGIYITNEDLPEPVVNGIFCLSDDAPRRRLEDTGVSGSGEIKVCISAADPRDSINSSEARTSSSVFGDKSDDSAANGPPSPCDVPPPPIWPRLETDTRRRRTRLSHQSSDERDDDHFHRTPHRKCGVIFRADSPSEGESESGTSARASSPSPFNPSDVSDVESRDGKRRPVRPVRGPYGKMLDTPTLRSNRSFDERENSRRSFSDATVPHRKTSAGGPPRSTPTHVRATSSPSKLAVMRGAAGGADFLAELLRGSSEALSNSRNFDNVVLCLQQNVNDTRTHVVVELYDTERSYVEALETLVKKYLHPLKSPENAGLVDAFLVDEIFYQVPAILSVHEVFLEELRRRLETWDVNQKVGDVFLNVFAKPPVMDTYMSFINNWKKAKETIKTASASRPAFARFLDAMARDHKGKLSLDNLLIKPVQKFPSYELLIQRLIKHTDPSHPDHKLLLDAQKEIHELLVKINCTERESLELEQQQQTLRDLEQLIEGLSNLVTVERVFLRHDNVTMPSATGAHKDRALFLFSDLLLITSVKRRTGTIRKPIPTYQSSIASQMEGNKYKLLMRIALAELEVIKAKDENTRRLMQEVETLADDVSVLTQISDLTASLHAQHTNLEDTVREMLLSLNKQLSDRQNSDTQLCYLELSLNTANGTENLTLIFAKTEKRTKWEALLNETKQKLSMIGQERPAPAFLSPVPIRKTRAGLQFTCAAPTLPPQGQSPDVWVCNSDGYVGQVCVLTLTPKPQVTSCNGVCNARILCVACVPPAPALARQHTLDIPSTSTSTASAVKPGISISDADNSCKNIRLDSSSSSDDEDDGSSTSENQDTQSDTRSQESVSNLRSVHSTSLNSSLIGNHQRSPNQTTLTPSHSKSLSTPYTGQNITVHPVMKSSSNPAVDKQAMGITSGTLSSPASRQSSEDSSTGVNQPTMWLGTEDGFIHVYNCNDNIRIKKNKIKLQHGSTVLRIVYVDSKVFVALGNGDLVVYGRDIEGGWVERCTLSVGTGSSPVSSTLLYNGRLWCATHNTIKIVNPQSLQVEDTFQVGVDTSKPISNMAIAGSGIWLSLHNTPQLKCHHAVTRELLADINITPSVTKMLHGCDEIIRQHKAACLRVTSLLAWKDTLWVGTSAGVLLTAPLQNAPDANGVFTVPQLAGVNYGHTGHVRFLTVVDNPVAHLPVKPTQTTTKAKATNRRSANVATLQKPQETNTTNSEILIISGGDGYEDFRNSTSTEDAGREDSTNHLLLWRV